MITINIVSMNISIIANCNALVLATWTTLNMCSSVVVSRPSTQALYHTVYGQCSINDLRMTTDDVDCRSQREFTLGFLGFRVVLVFVSGPDIL